MHRTTLLLALSAILPLSGCDVLGIETATQVAEKKEAEARAIGSACRHAVRSVEDCFRSNPKAGKAAVFAGWKDMDAYMRENEIVGMPSAPAADEPAGSGSSGSAATEGTPTSDAQPRKAQRS